MQLDRRHMLTMMAASGAVTACTGIGKGPRASGPDWQIGYANAPAEGFDPAPLRLISGRLPAGLRGSFYRNGPAWFTYDDAVLGHWFDGDGMVQRIAFDGEGAVHSGRFVETNKHRAEQEARAFLAAGFGSKGDPGFAVMSPDDVNAANTSVMVVNGELLALWEAGSAMRMDPETLETRGYKTWRDDLKAMPFLAHPKREPDGRIWNLAVADSRIGVYRISASGQLEDFGLLDMGKTAYLHDWAMTDRHLVILIQPWIQTRNTPPFVDALEWQPGEGLKLMIVDKDDFSSVRHAEVDGHAFFHTGAAWEDADGTVHVDACLYDRPALGPDAGRSLMQGRFDPDEEPTAALSRIVVPRRGPARIEKTSVDGEFPVVHPAFHGHSRRLTALVGGEGRDRPGFTRLSLFDWQSGRHDSFDYGPGRIAEEHLFVARPGGRSERDAWLIGSVLNYRRRRNEVHIFDVADISAGPVASYEAPRAWPLGFHGTFHPA